ncbi:PREDICTED: uncharacterized protein LOC105970510 [Erythranthe guttata]|uniref:uncharacterized protein LOC105970510 n=1 Tax=Erythranthe guttata TaxID=4155 RepID=UPI00064D90F8|nr:PREDICTED: uncharacterized protein LOC105970510 [Erythranthe guttata]|eukprot:XP_012850801.1 PREDICTED: uncharacterized protein LOC105970510 [Erythranthe guttata]
MSALSQEEAKISDLSQSHVPPKKILANLRQNGLGLDAYSKQIYNEKAKLKRLSRGDRTVMQHLIGLLEEHNYYKWFRTDETTHAVTDLMWAHPQSVELLSKFPYVLLLDSTYKTNQYKLPLLEIVGVTPVGKNFTVAVAFLRHENEDHYTWVLQKLKRLSPPQTLPSAIVTDRELGPIKALENVFPTVPHLLCLWHINMNVGRRASRCLGNSRRRGTAFVLGTWQTLVKSVSEEDFAMNYTALLDEYANYPDLIEYLQYTWLVYKEKFVKAWTDLIFHLGNTSTSRVESNHRALKRWLESSTGGFDTFWAQYHSMMKDQFNEILADFAKSKRIRAQTINVPVFKILSSGIVTHNALQMLDDEKDEDIDGCVCYMRKCLGLPCRHEIRAKMNARRGVFYAEDVHIFWRTFISGFGDSLDKSVGSVPDHRSQAIGRLEGLMNDLRERSEIEITDVTDVIFERMHPGAMEMNEPPVLACPRGRPRTNSTQRDLSGHEFPLFPGEGEESRRGRGRSRGNRGRGSSSERSSRGRSSTVSGPAIGQIPRPPWMRHLHFCLVPEVVTWTDVQGDGNCGYRSVACAVKNHEDDWMDVRMDVYNCIKTHEEFFKDYFGGGNLVYRVLASIAYWDNAPAPYEKWMTITDVGVVVATYYNALVLSASSLGNQTYLPLWAPEGVSQLSYEMTILFLESGSHFVYVKMNDNCPLPPFDRQWARNNNSNEILEDSRILMPSSFHSCLLYISVGTKCKDESLKQKGMFLFSK